MFKRVLLFVLTNLAVILLLSIILSLLGVNTYVSKQGLDYRALLIFAAVFGFGGAFISLFLSKFIAKMSMGVKVIQTPSGATEIWLVNTVRRIAERVGVGMPEVGIYDSPAPNAFATGWNRNKALVAVSSGLFQAMTQDEIEGVLGHELSHVANGDMVTLTLLQGVLNTFVIFFARVAAFFVTRALSRDETSDSGVGGFTYYLIAFVFQIVFGILATMIVMWFSRYREFRADAGSAKLLGKQKMIMALQKLQQVSEQPVVVAAEKQMAPAMAAMQISSGHSILGLFASHPPLAKRIEVLQRDQF